MKIFQVNVTRLSCSKIYIPYLDNIRGYLTSSLGKMPDGACFISKKFNKEFTIRIHLWCYLAPPPDTLRYALIFCLLSRPYNILQQLGEFQHAHWSRAMHDESNHENDVICDATQIWEIAPTSLKTRKRLNYLQSLRTQMFHVVIIDIFTNYTHIYYSSFGT